MDLNTLLLRQAQRLGKRYVVDTGPEVRLLDDPTSPRWLVVPGSAYLGSADDQYVSHLYGYYVATVDGVTGLPATYGVVIGGPSVTADEMAAQFGRKAYNVDLTQLGVLSSSDAQDYVDNMFALVGARMGWTNGIDVTETMLREIGAGQVSPMSMFGAGGAGSMLRVMGAMDDRSQPTTLPHVDVVLGEVTRFHDEQRVAALPVGFTPRDFQAVFTPPSVRSGEAA